MKNSFWFPVLLTLLALFIVSCASVKWPASSAYSDKARSGLRPERDPAVKKQEKSAESAPTKDNHTDHHAAGHHAEHHHGMACAANLPREKSDIPDLMLPRWNMVAFLVVPASENMAFHYFFFRDTTRPALPIAATTVTPFQNAKESPLTRITWEVGDEIRSAFLKTSELVCVKPVVTHNEERLGLDGFYKRLKARATIQGALQGANLP